MLGRNGEGGKYIYISIEDESYGYLRKKERVMGEIFFQLVISF